VDRSYSGFLKLPPRKRIGTENAPLRKNKFKAIPDMVSVTSKASFFRYSVVGAKKGAKDSALKVQQIGSHEVSKPTNYSSKRGNFPSNHLSYES